MTAAVTSQLAGLDARLPGLDELFDPRGVALRFERVLQSDLLDCTLLGARYDPGAGCVATYAVATRAGARTIGVVELTPEAWRVRSYDDDPALPGLGEAADARAAAALLGVRACTVTPVRYRPGQRAVLRYDAEHSTGSSIQFGKVVRSGLAELTAAFTDLEGRSRTGAGPLVPAPTVVVERLGLLVLPAVEGRALHALVFDDAIALGTRVDACRSAGRAVARLHGGPPPASRVSPLDDVVELERAAAALRVIDPGLGEQWTAALSALTAADATSTEAVPSHGALRTDQIVVTPAGPALLDLDGFCAARPARDLGNLVAYLRWRALRRPADAVMVAAARDAVLAGYDEEAPLPDAADLDRHEGLSLLKIAARRYRNLDAAEWPLVPQLVAAGAALAGRAT